MEDKYKDLISFQRLKELLQERNIKVKDFAAQAGIANMGGLISGRRLPLTDKIARMAGLLKVPVSEICLFRKIDIKPYFERELFYEPSKGAGAELTYRPLRRFLEAYLEERPGKTADDLYDKIETERKHGRNLSEEQIASMLEKRGYKLGVQKVSRMRRKYAEGLPYETRTKLRQDRPLNIRTIYDICKFLGCSIDFVMSYK